MTDSKARNLNDFLETVAEQLSDADLLSIKLMGKISDAFTQKRLTQGLTQKEFAEELGVTQASVSKWESGEYNLSIQKLAEISDKMDLDIDITLRDFREKSDVENIIDYYENRITYIRGTSRQRTARLSYLNR